MTIASDGEARIGRARTLLEQCGVEAAGLSEHELVARAEHIADAAARYQAGSSMVEMWDRHLASEFGAHDVDATMDTMVGDPYLLHVPVITGDTGRAGVRRFYSDHFIPKIPADWEITEISRTVGADQIVDEMVATFTHDTEVDFLLPGVPPSGRHVEVPIVAIGAFRGDEVRYEHIYWDQASVLVQIGLLDQAGLPVAGVEQTRKLLDDTGPFNALIGASGRGTVP
ncbi:MAG TPA: nuclear transport factor 2 family protein [Acidimicrobiales bacterium]